MSVPGQTNNGRAAFAVVVHGRSDAFARWLAVGESDYGLRVVYRTGSRYGRLTVVEE